MTSGDPIVIVCGVGREPLGAATASRLSTAGAALMLADRDGDAAELLASRLRDAGGTAIAAPLDPTDDGAVAGLVERTVSALGVPTGLVTVADPHSDEVGLLTEVDEEAFDRTVADNITAAWSAMRHVAPVMVAHGRGSIVNIASVSADLAFDTVGHAGAMAGIVALSRNAAFELGPHGVRVNSVCAGAVDGMALAPGKGVDDLAAIAGLSMLGRAASPAEIANVVAFLIGEESSFCTGASFAVDGGWKERRP